MSTATITGLKDEIARLEHELDRHRRALQILEGGGGRATQKPAPAAPAAPPAPPAPAAPPARPAAQKAIKVLIQEVLTARAPEKLTPSEIVQQIAHQGQRTNFKNIHARLSELAKAKAVSRQAGRYWIPQKQQAASPE